MTKFSSHLRYFINVRLSQKIEIGQDCQRDESFVILKQWLFVTTINMYFVLLCKCFKYFKRFYSFLFVQYYHFHWWTKILVVTLQIQHCYSYSNALQTNLLSHKRFWKQNEIKCCDIKLIQDILFSNLGTQYWAE